MFIISHYVVNLLIVILKGITMKSQVLSLLCGISFLMSSPVFGMDEPEIKPLITKCLSPALCMDASKEKSLHKPIVRTQLCLSKPMSSP